MGTQQTPPQGRLDEQPQGPAQTAVPQDEPQQRPLTEEEKKAAQQMLDSVEEKRPRTPNSDLLQLIVDSGDQQGYSRKIVEAELIRDAFDQDWRAAKVFALSGQFSDIKGTTQIQAISTAMAKIQLGRSWGLTQGDSIEFIYFTNGRPAVMNELVAAKLQDAGWDWEIQFQRDGSWEKSEGRCTGCRLWLKKNGSLLAFPLRNGDGQIAIDPETKLAILRPVSIEFTKADADRAIIWEKGKQIPLTSKWNFVSWAEDMYYWRCVGRLKKRYAPNVLRGAKIQAEAEDIVAGHEFVDITPVSAGPSAREQMRETTETLSIDAPSANGNNATNSSSPSNQSTAPPPTQTSGVRRPVRPINQ